MKGKTQATPLVVGQLLTEDISPEEDGSVLGAEVFGL